MIFLPNSWRTNNRSTFSQPCESHYSHEQNGPCCVHTYTPFLCVHPGVHACGSCRLLLAVFLIAFSIFYFKMLFIYLFICLFVIVSVGGAHMCWSEAEAKWQVLGLGPLLQPCGLHVWWNSVSRLGSRWQNRLPAHNKRLLTSHNQFSV